MPPPYVTTIEDEIYYEYAKLISRSALGKISYSFVSDRYKALRRREITMSDTIREWQREQKLPKVCVFCGVLDNLTTDHIIPRSRGGDDSSDNLVLACMGCNTKRGDKGVFVWLGLKEKDRIHRLVHGKYLKMLYELHEAAGTLSVSKDSITVLCARCVNGKTCEENDCIGKLTCFCLESIF